MARSLNAQIVRVMSALTVAAFALMVLGTVGYYTFIDGLFYPEPESDRWTLGDFVVLGLILAISLAAAAVVAWYLAQRIVRPLKSVAAAVHSIARGDFSARAETFGPAYNEAESLIADFNAMAARLESAEAELKYSNSAIAHELRTPLTILRGRLQGLSDGAFVPSPELYDRLIAHVDDLSRVVEDLRILGLSNAGKLELQLDQIDLAQEVGSVMASVEQDLAKADIVIDARLESVLIRADRARIRQAVFALLENVRRYAPGCTVTMYTGYTDDGAIIRCSDNGPGLPAGTEYRAFERFWRADESRGRTSGGSGLGLPVIQAIARAHGGDAMIVSNDGTGLSMEIRLSSR